MFLLTPLALILVSLVGIAIIVWRKRTYLNKIYAINTAGNETEASLLNSTPFSWRAYCAELFPEVGVVLEKLKFNEYKTMWLMETEKMLRKTRVQFLKVDRWSDTLIKKVRRMNFNHQNGIHVEEIEQPTVAIPVGTPIKNGKTEKISPAFLKNDEERLIIEIAKNPKDPSLYEQLGDLYLEMGNYSDAKESFEAAVELNSGDIQLKSKLSGALEKLAQN
jgi:tetratricopeptide (TPR) repeat protein